jgi:hypothetical protein
MRAAMQNTSYHVIVFHHDHGNLAGMAPIKFESEIAAVGEAQRLAQGAAGAIVLGRLGSGDRHPGELEIIFKTGEVPDAVPDPGGD